MKIFLTGATSCGSGGMEYHNLGNFVIAEPMFDLLRKTFPDAKISTSMQMSDGFYERHKIVACTDARFWTYGVRTGLATAIDILRTMLWKITGIKRLLSTPLLKIISESDLVIDFSGDIYGDNAYWTKFLETNARLILACLLRKNVAMIIGSPGPFSSYWRQWVAKRVMPKLTIITNREPLSTAMLAYVGIKGSHIHTTACPSVFLKPEPIETMPRNEDFMRLFEMSKPIIGIILCGWNMPVGPYSRWPREDWEFDTFISLIDHLLKNSNYRICLMSHQNATSSDGKLIKGNDHRIIDRLIELLGCRYDGDNLFTLCGLYTARQSKAIIGCFDILISGRIHGAVQGLSQGIPTAIIDYGHEPKAHKLRGFARVYGVDDYVCDPTDKSCLIETAAKLVKERDVVRDFLKHRVEEVKKMAAENFDLLKSLSDVS